MALTLAPVAMIATAIRPHLQEALNRTFIGIRRYVGQWAFGRGERDHYSLTAPAKTDDQSGKKTHCVPFSMIVREFYRGCVHTRSVDDCNTVGRVCLPDWLGVGLEEYRHDPSQTHRDGEPIPIADRPLRCALRTAGDDQRPLRRCRKAWRHIDPRRVACHASGSHRSGQRSSRSLETASRAHDQPGLGGRQQGCRC